MISRFVFGRISDANLIRLTDELYAAFDTGSVSIDIGDTQAYSVTKSEDEGEASEGRENYVNVLSDNSYLVTEASWQASSLANSLKYYRGKIYGFNVHGQAAWVAASSPFTDSIQITMADGNAPILLDIVQKHIQMAPPVIAGPEATTAMDQSQAILNRMSAVIATLVEHTSQRQTDLDDTRAAISRNADKQVRAQKDIFLADLEKVKSEYAVREKGIAEREAGLDDRANTHVRREFAAQMASLSDTRLSSNLLSKSQLSFIVPIALAVIPSIILLILIGFEFGYITSFNDNIASITKDVTLSADQKRLLISNTDTQILYAQLRIGIQSLGIGALIWFALRLASARYQVVSDWERELHKFRLDTERAGFLVEGDLEARKVNDQGLPDVMLESFSRNLFAGSDRHGTDVGGQGLGGALNALLGQAAKVRVGPDGVNVEVEGKGIRKARKLIDDGET